MYRIAACLLFAPTLAVANDPLGCVDPEFVRAFLSGSGEIPVSYSTEFPDHFEVQELPSDFNLLGSQHERHSTTVVFKTKENVRDTHSTLAELLSNQGWLDVTYDRAPSRRGLQTATPWQVAEFCRNADDKNLTVVVDGRSGRTLVSLKQFDRRTLHGCLAERTRHRELMGYQPILTPPDNARTSGRLVKQTGDSASIWIDVSAPDDHNALLGFLGTQVQDQGWALLTDWSSDLSSGSVWSKITPELGVIIGTLHAYTSGEGPLRVQFNINSTSTNNSTNHGASYEISGRCG